MSGTVTMTMSHSVPTYRQGLLADARRKLRDCRGSAWERLHNAIEALDIADKLSRGIDKARSEYWDQIAKQRASRLAEVLEHLDK